MAVDMFLKVAGIEGESQDSKHKNEIDVLAWSWGASQSGTAHVGGGAGSGKASIQDLSITKWVDKASTLLFKAVCNGQHIPEINLVVRKAGEQPLEYLKLKMEECIISSLSTGGSGGEDRLTENITLNFAKFEFVYTKQDEKGKPAGEVPLKFDIQANKVL